MTTPYQEWLIADQQLAAETKATEQGLRIALEQRATVQEQIDAIKAQQRLGIVTPERLATLPVLELNLKQTNTVIAQYRERLDTLDQDSNVAAAALEREKISQPLQAVPAPGIPSDPVPAWEPIPGVNYVGYQRITPIDPEFPSVEDEAPPPTIAPKPLPDNFFPNYTVQQRQALANVTIDGGGNVTNRPAPVDPFDADGEDRGTGLINPPYTTSPASVQADTTTTTGTTTNVPPGQIIKTPRLVPEGESYADDQGNLLPGYIRGTDGVIYQLDGQVDPGTAGSAAATRQAVADRKAREQSTLQQRYNQTTNGDWRVRLRLAPNSPNVLYKAQLPGILLPLVASDGVIFPYTPTVQTAYRAKYESAELPHSNYRGYFYRGSYVEPIQVTGIFTAQDTAEAQYLLAVIHFFRSVTKMFYGQDNEYRGVPPPLVELSGFGQYQFNNHPCVVSSFTYNLPNGVDYIRTVPNNQGLNLGTRGNKVNSSPFSVIGAIGKRVEGLWDLMTQKPVGPGATKGSSPRDNLKEQKVYGTGTATYVPTKIEITIELLPIQTRQQVSQQFSLKQFAAGDQLRGGFW